MSSPKIKNIFIEVRDVDAPKFYSLIVKLIEYAQNKKDIPYPLINEITDLILLEDEKVKIDNEEIGRIVKKAITDFAKYKYNFQKTNPVKESKTLLDISGEPEYSFSEMMKNIFEKVLYLIEKRKLTSDEFIFECYKTMNDYQRFRFIPKKILTEYKKETISAYVAKEKGFISSNTSYKKLHEIGRNAIRRCKKKEKKISPNEYFKNLMKIIFT